MQRVVFPQRASDLAEALALKLTAEGQKTVVLRTCMDADECSADIIQVEQFAGLKCGIFDIDSRGLVSSVSNVRAGGFDCVVIILPDLNMVPRPVGHMALSVQVSRFGRPSAELLVELAQLMALASCHQRTLLWIELLDDDMTTSST